MPTYEYVCSECGHNFEQFQGINDNPLRICPTCGAPLKRLIGPGAGVISKNKLNGTARLSRCGHERPCCGREIPCDSSPCDR